MAQFVVAALQAPRIARRVVKLGGPDPLSLLAVVRLAESLIGRPIAVQSVPEDALRAQLATATDPLQKSFAGLMLYYAGGEVIEMAETLRDLPVPPLRTVREHLVKVTGASTRSAH